MSERSKELAASPEGELIINAGRYARNAVLTTFQMIGGVDRMAQWADSDPEAFYTKLFSKTITRDTEIHTSETVEDLLERLSAAERSGELEAEAVDVPANTQEAELVEDEPDEDVDSDEEWLYDGMD